MPPTGVIVNRFKLGVLDFVWATVNPAFISIFIDTFGNRLLDLGLAVLFAYYVERVDLDALVEGLEVLTLGLEAAWRLGYGRVASRQDGSGGGRVLVELIVVVALLTVASRCHYILSLHIRHPGMFSEHLVGCQPLLVALV